MILITFKLTAALLAAVILTVYGSAPERFALVSPNTRELDREY